MKRIKNVSKDNISITWSFTLLSDEQLEIYNQHKLTDDYLGHTPEERSARSRMGEGLKLKEWANIMGDKLENSVPVQVWQLQHIGDQVIKTPVIEWMFQIRSGQEIEISDRQFEAFRVFIRREIPQKNVEGEIITSKTEHHEGGQIEVIDDTQKPAEEIKATIPEPSHKTETLTFEVLSEMKYGELSKLAKEKGIGVGFRETKKDKKTLVQEILDDQAKKMSSM